LNFYVIMQLKCPIEIKMEMAGKIFDQLLLSNFMKIRYWFWSCYILVFICTKFDGQDDFSLVVTPQERECEGCHSLKGLLHFRCLASNCTASCFIFDVSHQTALRRASFSIYRIKLHCVVLHFRCLASNCTASLCFPDTVFSFSY